MRKLFVTLTFFIALSAIAQAQRGGLIYYLKNSGKLVSTKDSADYSMVVLPPDTSINKKLYVVYEYYPNGKVRLITNSKTKDLNLLYQGRYIAYYPDGKKKTMGNYDKGKSVGREMSYFPNGKLANIKNYDVSGKLTYEACHDSTGIVLSENGNGKWVQYDENLNVAAEGEISGGTEDGVWHVRINDSVTIESKYDKGKIITKEDIFRSGRCVYEKAELDPEFPGGEQGYIAFLRNSFGTGILRESGAGSVSFIVEKDGRLTNFQIPAGASRTLSAEVLRLMKLSPPWTPGFVGGVPVRTLFLKTMTFTTAISARVSSISRF